ncbi:hypothetical protein [Lewinella sp. IMCC34191]|uniref:hypothetical protein n=1 Tax=Lewinella sp. IMCC34191 TaxID=2259172 RepID=UPI000E234952|nr:hypothetical protein [Lewinella sp. IMCC34191]
MRLTVFLFFIPLLLPGQTSLFDALFTTGDTAVIELHTEWKKLLRQKHQKAYRDAEFTIDGTPFPGRIRTRGHARLQACRFPSLKIKLKKQPLVRAGYSELNDLKFVLQCSSNREGIAYLRRERLLYDLYTLLSPYHHRTLPVRLVLPRGDTLEGFLIEAEEQLEQRFDGDIHEDKQVSTRAVDRSAYLTLCLFNYMILNTDWNIFNLHNVECLHSRQDDRLIPIPYDFDHSGLVDAHYAVPREDLGMESIYEARFLGRHVTWEEIQEVANHFLTLQDEITHRVENEAGHSKAYRRQVMDRLEEFFAELKDKERLTKLVSN